MAQPPSAVWDADEASTLLSHMGIDRGLSYAQGMLASLLRYRAFIWRQALADLRSRYAATGMGVAWNVLHPLAIIAIYSIVFSHIMPVGNLPGKLPFTVYLCSGFFPWIAFQDCVMRGATAFVANAGYLKKLPVPEPVFVAQAAAGSTITLAISMVLLMVVSMALGFSPRWTWLLIPLPLLLMQAMGFGFGLLLGTLNVFFRDIAEWLAILLQLAMWTVPIVYVATILPGPMKLILPFHPFMPVLTAMRDLFLHGQLPPLWTWGAMLGWTAAGGLAAMLVLRALREEIRDVI